MGVTLEGITLVSANEELASEGPSPPSVKYSNDSEVRQASCGATTSANIGPMASSLRPRLLGGETFNPELILSSVINNKK